jgi:hypothetical protein
MAAGRLRDCAGAALAMNWGLTARVSAGLSVLKLPMAAINNPRGWWVAALLAILVGTGWRMAHLANRPLHTDEAVQAWQTWELLRGHGYRYDPVDRHGPLLYFGAAALHRVTGGTAATFDDVAARRFVLLAGVATLVLVGFASERRVGAVAVALLATETLSTLYQTYFVQEAWLAFFVWAFFFRLLRPLTPRGLFVLGLLAGLAQTCKEITPVYLVLVIVSVGVATRAAGWRAALTPRAIGLAVLGFVVPAVLLYTSFGSHPGGLLDAFRAYVLQVGHLEHSPHAYPWWQVFHYLGLVGTRGPAWAEYTLLALAAGGALLAIRAGASASHRAAALFTSALLLLHSLVGYKTPWLLLTAEIGLGLLAAHALCWIGARHRFAPVLAVMLGLMVVGENTWRGWLALDGYPGDSRNPYFYEQTPRGFMALPERVTQLESALGRPLRIAVVSHEYAWPLPWYWRDREAVGYFTAAPPDPPAWDVVVWDSQLGELPAAWSADRVVDYVGLRPNVLLEVGIAQAVWDQAFPPAP